MAQVMKLPKLGVNMEKATIVEWLVQVSEKIIENQYILSAETDKAVVEIPATVSGILAQQLVKEGDTVNVGEPVGVFVDEMEELPADFSVSNKGKALGGKPKADVAEIKSPQPPPFTSSFKAENQPRQRVKISPLARKTAKEIGVEPTQVKPAKPGARITKSDVLRYAESMKKAPALSIPETSPQLPVDDTLTVKDRIPLEGIRKTIADRLWTSSQANARAVLFASIEMTAMQNWREDLKKKGHTVSYNSLMVAVLAKALSEFPAFNARIKDQEIQLIQEINIGVAVDTARGLLVPTIRNANQRGVVSIDIDFKEKVKRAKAGKASMEDLSGGTFTITNLGMFEVEAFVPIINPPEAAIISMGATEKRAVVLADDSISVKPMMRICLAWDHRINDGAPAARFLDRIKEIVEWPLTILS